MKQNITSVPKATLYILGGVTAGVIVSMGMQVALATWNGPTGIPPSNNTNGPITDSPISQYKRGQLGVNTSIAPTLSGLGLSVGGNMIIGGKIYSASTIDTDSGSTVVTKDYLKNLNFVSHTETQNINMSGNQMMNLGVPVNSNDAATKAYVDSKIAPPTRTATLPPLYQCPALDTSGSYCNGSPDTSSFGIGVPECDAQVTKVSYCWIPSEIQSPCYQSCTRIN